MFNIENLYKLIDEHQVVSFDVYDTLLLRPFCLPSDLFKHIEIKYNISGFYAARNSVCVPNKKEKTIEDIYDNMPTEFKNCIEYELKEEKEIVYLNPIIKEIFDYAKKSRKRIIIISDIYFHEDYLAKVLLEKGIYGYEKIYCSCDHQMTKCEGELFKLVLDDLQVKASDVLHIGDNEISDFTIPKAMGIDVFFIPQNYQQYRDYREYLPIKYSDLWDSIINKVCADNFSQSMKFGSEEEYVWYRFGHDVAGPICWTFAKWIRQSIDNGTVDLSDLAFVARDGYLVKKMFDLMPGRKNVKSHYVYAPRILTTLLQENYKDTKDIQKLSEKEKETINKIYALDDLSPDERSSFVMRLSNAYKRYLENENFGDGTIGVVDSTTNYLSSQKLIDLYTKNLTCGLYWFATEYAFSKGYNILTCQDEHYIVVESVDLFELIFKSPEPTIKCFSISGNIEFNEVNSSEKHRIDNFVNIERGAMDFFDGISKISIEGFPSAKVINDYLIRYCKNPISTERQYIENGKSSGGIANTILEPTKVFIDANKTVTPHSFAKEIKKRIMRHPRLFLFLRNTYHSIRQKG